jgi:hypothetical protein
MSPEAEEKGNDSEIERLRRLVHPIHEANPSRMKRIIARLINLKTNGGSKQKDTKANLA